MLINANPQNSHDALLVISDRQVTATAEKLSRILLSILPLSKPAA